MTSAFEAAAKPIMLRKLLTLAQVTFSGYILSCVRLEAPDPVVFEGGGMHAEGFKLHNAQRKKKGDPMSLSSIMN